MADQRVYESVSNYYGKVLSTSKDLKTSACTASKRPSAEVRAIIARIPDEIVSKFYGCGQPFPAGIKGLSVLDLGSGSGRDCYVAASLVGETGSVTGIDMTDEQVSVARKYVDEFCTKTLGYSKPNLKFVTGHIEFLERAGIENASMDLVISNCVINLSPRKELVVKAVYDALRFGGELYFSDVYCDRRLPEEAVKHEVLFGECIGGALYIEDFKRICHSVGFTDPRVVEAAPIEINDPELLALVGEAKFYSITYRCFKLKNLETLCEDYGQVAIYKGTIEGHLSSYPLDNGHRFEKNKPALVCGNTASMLEDSWLAPHFTIIGNRNVHFGLFDCSPSPASATPVAPAADCGAGGSCC